MERKNPFATSAVTLLVLGFLGGSLSEVAHAVEPTVPGLNELVILQPGAHERGLPAVRLDRTWDGNHLVVDIPPTVHVHRYYYSGDKEFQGPIIQGGPTVVVANHPKTGERMYIEVNLPSGAPKIVHNQCGIAYVYRDRRVILRFSGCQPEKVIVQHVSGRGVRRHWREFHAKVKTTSRNAWQRSPLAQSAKETTVEGGRLVLGAKEGAESMAAGVIDVFRQAAASLPGVNALRSYAEDRPMRRELQAVGSAATAKARSATEYIPTNR